MREAAVRTNPYRKNIKAKGAGRRHVLNVLAVDDDPSVVQVLSWVLSGSTCAVTTVESAAEAMTAIARPYHFDVVITDNRMPIASGLQLVQRLRENKFTSRIIVLSAYVSPEDEEEYRRLGVKLFLPKPFAVSDLRRAIGL